MCRDTIFFFSFTLSFSQAKFPPVWEWRRGEEGVDIQLQSCLHRSQVCFRTNIFLLMFSGNNKKHIFFFMHSNQFYIAIRLFCQSVSSLYVSKWFWGIWLEGRKHANNYLIEIVLEKSQCVLCNNHSINASMAVKHLEGKQSLGKNITVTNCTMIKYVFIWRLPSCHILSHSHQLYLVLLWNPKLRAPWKHPSYSVVPDSFPAGTLIVKSTLNPNQGPRPANRNGYSNVTSKMLYAQITLIFRD